MPLNTVDGIASGLNTTEIIDAIIEFERRPAVLLEAEQAQKTNIVTTFKAFQAKALALKTQVRQLSLQNSFNKTAVSVSDDAYLSASASGSPVSGSYAVKIQSLASNHQMVSQGFDDESEAILGTGTITLQYGTGSEEVITVDAGNNSLIGVANAINEADLGIKASIVNDGTESRPYRLMLTGQKTGFGNTISIEASLTGGRTLNYTSGEFDAPETIVSDPGSSAVVSLAPDASYAGSANKMYTFTVQGSGSQTTGTDPITIAWTDGTDSGTILVNQADEVVELVGEGADGLKLSVSAGTLNAGDTFQVAAFAPLIQEARDARISIGGDGATGSPIVVTSKTNKFTNIVGGLSLTAKKVTAPGDAITVTTDIDVSGLRDRISQFIDAYNDVMVFIDKQNTYNADTEESGVLFGEYSLQAMQNQIRSVISSPVSGITSGYNILAAIGIRTKSDGELAIMNSSTLETALTENLDDVIRLFTNGGSTSSNYIEFIDSTGATKIGDEYEVNVTQAATRGYFNGSGISDPATSAISLTGTNNRLKVIVDGTESNELILTQKTYNSTDELVREIQDKIDSDGRIGNRGLNVEWVETGTGTGYLSFTSSRYGSTSSVQMVTSQPNSALTALGLLNGSQINGKDVAGTINGEAAVGEGQYLSGKEGNSTTEGLRLKVTFTEELIGDGAEGTVTLSRGVAARLNDLVDSLTKTGDGMIDRRISSYQAQVDQLAERIADFDERLVLRRERLYQKYQAMEEAIGLMNSQNSYLTAQLNNINANWNFSSGNN